LPVRRPGCTARPKCGLEALVPLAGRGRHRVARRWPRVAGGPLSHPHPALAAMAGALRVQLEKPGQYVLGDSLEPLTGDKILGALRIRDVTIVLWGLFCVGVIVAVRLFFLPI